MYMTPEQFAIIINNIKQNPQQVDGYTEALIEAYNQLYYDYAIYIID